MKKVEFDKVKITVDENYIYFDGIKIGLENIESVHCISVPRRSLFIGIKEWFRGLLIILIIYTISVGAPEIERLLEIYCYTFPLLIIFNIIMFIQKYYGIIIRTTSGQEYIKKHRKILYLNEIKETIENKKEEKLKRNKNHSIINKGIINTGNNNQNKIVNKRIYTNYIKIEEELKMLLSHTEEKEIVKEAIKASKEKNSTKLKRCLSKIGKSTIKLIKELGLIALEKYIETYILK